MDAGSRPSNTDYGISIKSIELTPIKLSKSEGWFKAGDKLVVLIRKKNNTLVAIIGNNVENVYTIGPEGLNCMRHSIPLNGVDICEQVDEILRNYDALVLQFELEEKAKATRTLNYSAVPRMPNEFETMVNAIADLVLSRVIIKTFYIPSQDKKAILGIYCYNNGYYTECEDLLRRDIYDIVRSSAGGEVKLIEMRLVPAVKGSVIKIIADKTMTEYNPQRRCLLFRDKVFCWDAFVETGDIEAALFDPSPDLVVMHRIPWRINVTLLKRRPGLLKYIPPENIEQIITLFRELAPKSYNAFYSWVRKLEEPESATLRRVVLLLELIGYTLYPHEYPLHKAAMLVGDGSNGKSTYLRLIETILSRENIASVNLTQLNPNVNRFAAASLINKLANISSEPITGEFDVTSLFKELTGEDIITVERKYKDPVIYRNYAKMIFAANELPRVKDDSFAFWRRWIAIEFPNRFKPDPKFFERTFTQEEIEAVIILSLYAFRLVLKRGEFSETQTQQDVKSVWLSRSNPVYPVIRRMLEDGVIELRQDAYIVKTDLYALYKAYVELMTDEGDDVRVLAQKDFTIHLTRYFPVRTGTARVSGRQRHVYWGVMIKDYERVKELIGQVETPPRLL